MVTYAVAVHTAVTCLTQMRELRHDNLVPFLGACLEHDGIVILMPFCSRGGLDDVLRNEDYSLDNMFVASLVQDLIKVGHVHDECRK